MELTGQVRAALYLRVSTAEQAQEGYSIDAQRERLKAYCVSQDWKIVGIYEDAGYTGGNMNRPQLTKMRSDFDKKLFDILLVYKLDRLSRNMRDLSNLVNDLQKFGIHLKSATEPFDTSTPAGKLILNMLGSVAEFERGMIGERVKMGMIEKAKEGDGFLGFNHPYGYDYSNGKLEVNQCEAEVVRTIFKLYLQGESMGKIVEHLNALGISSKHGGKWAKGKIDFILGNPLYCGMKHWDGIVTKSEHPAIVSVEDYNEVQEIRKVRVKNRNRVRKEPGKVTPSEGTK